MSFLEYLRHDTVLPLFVLPLAKDRSPQAIDVCACYEMSNLMSGAARSALVRNR